MEENSERKCLVPPPPSVRKCRGQTKRKENRFAKNKIKQNVKPPPQKKKNVQGTCLGKQQIKENINCHIVAWFTKFNLRKHGTKGIHL